MEPDDATVPTLQSPPTRPPTPRELVAEIGVSDRTVRRSLRDRGWQSVPYARGHLTPEQADQVREHLRR